MESETTEVLLDVAGMGIYNLHDKFTQMLGLNWDGSGTSPILTACVYVGIAMLGFWCVKSSIRIIKDYMRSEGF